MDRAVDVGSIVSPHVKLCLYGQNGRGKSSLAAQFPKPLLLVSFEPTRSGGPTSLIRIPGVKVLRYGSPQEVEDGEAEFTSVSRAVAMAESLVKSRGGGFRTTVLDGATGLLRRVGEEMLKSAGKTMPESLVFGTMTSDEYTVRASKTLESLRPFLDIPTHVVVTAKEKDHNPPKEYNEKGKLVVDMRPKSIRPMGLSSFIAPEVSQSIYSWLVDACGYTFRMYSSPETVTTPASVVNGVTVPGQEVETGRYGIRVWLKQHDNYAGRGCFPDPSLVPDSIGGSSEELYAQLVRLFGVKM